jgi:hypothetical protein
MTRGGCSREKARGPAWPVVDVVERSLEGVPGSAGFGEGWWFMKF